MAPLSSAADDESPVIVRRRLRRHAYARFDASSSDSDRPSEVNEYDDTQDELDWDVEGDLSTRQRQRHTTDTDADIASVRVVLSPLPPFPAPDTFRTVTSGQASIVGRHNLLHPAH